MGEKGFFGVLFDFSFGEFLTVRIIKFLYILGIVFSGIYALIILVTLVGSAGVGGLFLGLVLAPVVFCVGVLMTRVWLEVLIVMFRIAENTSILVEQGKAAAAEIRQD